MKHFFIAIALFSGTYSLYPASAAIITESFKTPEEGATWLLKLFEYYASEVNRTSLDDRSSVEKMLTRYKDEFNLKCHLFEGKINIESLLNVFFHPGFVTASKEEIIATIVKSFSCRTKSFRGCDKDEISSLSNLLQKTSLTMEDSEEETDSTPSAASSYESENVF